MKKRALFGALFFVLPFLVYAFTFPITPTGHINDYANLLQEEDRQRIEQDLITFTASTTNEIAVVTIPSLEGEEISAYALRIFDTWKIGDKKNDNGLLLLISRDDRKVRIQTGYGLEGALPDLLAKNIIDTKITPSFKQGDYNSGIVLGLSSVKEAIKGEYISTEKEKNSSFSFNSNIIEFFLVFFFLAIQFVSSLFARSKSWWAGGVVGGLIGGGITFFGVLGITLFVGSCITAILILLGLLFDYVVSKTYQNKLGSGESFPWWIGGGGSGGGFSGGGDSFGGFGGGDTGGGGASGDW